MIEQAIDTTDVELEDKHEDISVRNPADLITSFDVIITDGVDTHKCRTHHYSIEDCAVWAIQSIDKHWNVIGVEQSGTTYKLNKKQLEGYKHG